MATFPGQWSPNTDLTGNSQFVIDSSSTLWVVSNVVTGSAVYSSTDKGVTFVQKVLIPAEPETTVAFDPAVCMDSAGVIHFIGQVNVGNFVAVMKYSYNPNTSTLSGPYTATSGSLIGSDYDIVALSNGNCFIVCSTLTASTETLYGIEIGPMGTIVHQDVIATSPLLSGNRIGSVSLITPDGSSVEIYLGQHPKLVTFLDFTVTLSVTIRSGPAAYATSTTIKQFYARHTDDRLTVIANGATRYLTQCYYTQTGLYLEGNLLLGYLASTDASWNFTELIGIPSASCIEPTFSLSNDGLVLAYIDDDFTKVPRADGQILLYDVIPATWTLTPRTDFHGVNKATYLRGTKSLFPTNMLWGFIGQTETLTASYYTGYNAPPVAMVEPTSITAVRGTLYELDASGSYDPNQDTLGFVWSLTDTTGTGILTGTGDTATFEVPTSIGPGAHSMSVTVAVTDYDVNGNPLHSAVTVSVPITIPAIAAPTIGTLTTATQARGVNVTLSPAITHAAGTTLTYLWEELTGTVLTVIGANTNPTLTFNTAGASLSGETIVWQLTVSDGTNTPVSQTFNVAIAASASLGEATVFLTRSTRAGGISGRNTPAAWPTPTTSKIFANFASVKKVRLLAGIDCNVYIGTNEVLVYGNNQIINGLRLRFIFLPNPADTILDAVHTETDYTIVLTSDSKLLQFQGGRPVLSTDSPDVTIDLTTLSSFTFTKVFATCTAANVRMIALSGPQGCLLLQMNNSTFSIQKFLELSEAASTLYGATHVNWVRLYDVESLATGQLLLGTTDSTGRTFETLLDLSTRQIIATWSASVLKNQFVTTGEILFEPESSYAGLPLPPVMDVPLIRGTTTVLTWSQERSDLVNGYILQYSTNGAAFITLATINSGSIQEYAAQLPGGNTYEFRIQAISLDGASAWSNIVS